MIEERNDVLHELIWRNEDRELDKVLQSGVGKDVHDTENGHVPFIDRKFRGTTPLGLAVQLGRLECIRVLLKHNADTLSLSDIGFFPMQEATSLGDRRIMRDILMRQHEQIRQLWILRQPSMHAALHSVPNST